MRTTINLYSIVQKLGYSYHSSNLRNVFCIISFFRKPEQVRLVYFYFYLIFRVFLNGKNCQDLQPF